MNSHNDDLTEIRGVIELFCEGIIECNYRKIFEVFHPDAKSIVVNQRTEEMITQTREHWKESHESNQCDPTTDSEFKIKHIEFQGSVGFAHVQIIDKFDSKDVVYTDFLSLIKVNKKWIIVNKIGHGEEILK